MNYIELGDHDRRIFVPRSAALAEYVSVPQDALAVIPAGATLEQAAAVPSSGYIALHNLQNGELIERGQSVLTNRAGGGVVIITP